jgi:hypothetical protein
MPNETTAPSPIAIRLRRLHANSWLSKWRATASHLFAATTAETGIMISDVETGDVVVALDWRQDKLHVSERGVSGPYVFVSIDSALTFLDALLTAHCANLDRQMPQQRRYA